MKFSIRPDHLIFSWIKNKNEKKLRIADYLDEISSEASELANIWDRIVNVIITDGKIGKNEHLALEQWVELPEQFRYVNRRVHTRIEKFYGGVSTVLGNENKELMESLLFRIGHIIQQRNLTQKFVEENLNGTKSRLIIEYKKSDKDSKINLLESVKKLNEEVAELHSLAKEYRAKI